MKHKGLEDELESISQKNDNLAAYKDDVGVRAVEQAADILTCLEKPS